MRNKKNTVVSIMRSIFLGLIVGMVYMNQDNNQTSVQNKNGAAFFIIVSQCLPTVFEVAHDFHNFLPMYMREYLAGMYRPDVFYIAVSVVNLPLQIMQPLVFSCIAWWMIGFNSDPDMFVLFTITLIVLVNVGYAMGYCISLFASNARVATAIVPVVLLPMALFCGYFVNLDTIPVIFVWIEYISFYRYGFEAVEICIWKDQTIGCDEGEVCQFNNGNEVLFDLGMNQNQFAWCLEVLLLLWVVFRIGAVIFLARRSVKAYEAVAPPDEH